MTLEHIARAGDAYGKSFGALLIANLLRLFITWSLVCVGGIIAAIAILAQPDIALMQRLLSAAPLLALAGILIGVGMAIDAVLNAGYIQLCADALKGRANWRTMFSAARGRWPTYLLAAIALGALWAVIFSPAAGLLVLGLLRKSIALALLALPVGLGCALVGLVLVLGMYAVVLEKLGVVAGIRRGIQIAAANYLELLILWIICGLITVLVGLIPFYIGTIIVYVFLIPLIMLIWTSFYMSKIKRRR